MIIPNILTLIRMALVPLFLVFAHLGMNIAALITFIIAALTDTADGEIARRFNQVTDFGKLFDPLADKLLVMAALLIFVVRGTVPAWAATVIIGRELAISSLRMIAASKGVVIAAAKSGKFKTLSQCICLSVMLFLWDKEPVIFGSFTVQDLCVIIMTLVAVVSMIDYFIRNRHVLHGSLGVKEKK